MAKFLRGISHLNELTNTVSNDYFNSFDHFVFGSVGEWMFRHVLGINPDIEHPGYEHFTIHPRSGGSLTWEKVRTTQCFIVENRKWTIYIGCENSRQHNGDRGFTNPFDTPWLRRISTCFNPEKIK